MDLKQFMMNLFMIIGIVVCVVVTVIALIYAVCYAVKLLFKTFGAKITASYEVMMEDIRENKIAKKERKKEMRTFNNEHKKEMQKIKLLSEAEVFEMKKRKYRDKLRDKENKAWFKLYGETEPRQVIIPQLEEKSLEVCNSSIVDTLLREEPKEVVEEMEKDQGQEVACETEVFETPANDVNDVETTQETPVETEETPVEAEEVTAEDFKFFEPQDEDTSSETTETLTEQVSETTTETAEVENSEENEGLKLDQVENSSENGSKKKKKKK